MTKKFLWVVVAVGIASFVLGFFVKTSLVSKDSLTNEVTNSSDVIPLKDAKLNIEHNATDNDTGFQGFVDSEGWENLTITGPEGKVLTFSGQGKLGNLGLTELFFETVEPANADVPIADMLAKLPEGDYEISGSAIEAGKGMGYTKGTAKLTHNIPSSPELLSPKEKEVVTSDDDLAVSWSAVTKTITGSSISIIAYQLIIEEDAKPHPHMIGKQNSLSMYLPSSTTRVTISKGFLKPKTNYKWEVLAIEESGNQTLSSGEFSTQ